MGLEEMLQFCRRLAIALLLPGKQILCGVLVFIIHLSFPPLTFSDSHAFHKNGLRFPSALLCVIQSKVFCVCFGYLKNKRMALVWHKHHVGQTPSPEQELPFEKEFQKESRTFPCSQSSGSFPVQGYVSQIFLRLKLLNWKMCLTRY